MAYRENDGLEFRRKLELIAEEEELEEIANDLEVYSQAEKAEVRLRTKGLRTFEEEDLLKVRKDVHRLIQQKQETVEVKREEYYKNFKKITTIFGIGLFYAGVFTGTVWFLSGRERALRSLSVYDKPTEIYNIEEREHIVSELDEIIEEHATDQGSDHAAGRYLKALETKKYSISDGAKALDVVGEKCYLPGMTVCTPSMIERTALDYLDFLNENEITFEKGECYLKLAKTVNEYLKIKNAQKFHDEGFCKN